MWLIYAMLAAVIWGASYSLDEQVFRQNISPISLLAAQAWIGGIIFTALGYFQNLSKDWQVVTHNRAVFWLTILALIAANLGAFFITLSIKAKNASLAAIIENAYPLFTLFFTYLFFKDNQFTVPVAIGLLFIISGLVIISYYSK